MKLKEGFLLKEVAGEIIVVPSGDDLDLSMMITLNETGRLLWECLEKGAEEADLIAALRSEYDVDEATAKTGVEHFVAKIKENGFLA